MKKTLFLSAILGAALCSSAFAETLTLDSDTEYNSTSISADAINLNGHKLTFNASAEPTQTINGTSGAIVVDTTTRLAATVTGLKLAGSSLNLSGYADGSVGTFGIQVYDGNALSIVLSGDNTTKGLCVREGGSSLNLTTANDSKAKLTVEGNLNIDTATDSITVGDGVTLYVSDAKLNTVAQDFAQWATSTSQLNTSGTGFIGMKGDVSFLTVTGGADAQKDKDQSFTFARNIHVDGDLSMQTSANWDGSTTANFATWDLGAHTMEVGGSLWLRNHQIISVSDGGVLSVGGQLKLGHESNGNDGKYASHVSVGRGAKLIANDVYLNANLNELSVDGGEVQFKKSSGNLLAGVGRVDECSFTFNDATLTAKDNSWTMQALGSMGLTVSGNTLLNAVGQTITFGVANTQMGHVDISGSIKGNGTLTLGYARLNGDLSFAGNADGQATGADVMVVNMNAGLSKKADIDPVALTIGGGVSFNLNAVSTNIINSVSVSSGSRLNICQEAALSTTTLSGAATIVDVRTSSALGALSGVGSVTSSTDAQKIVTIGNNDSAAAFTGSVSLGTTTLKKTGTNAQTITLNADSTIGHLEVESGSLSFNLNNHTLTTPSALSLTMGEGAQLTIGTESDHNNDLVTTTLTVNGDSTLNANLVVNSGTMNFTAGAVLTMGCSVTIGDTVEVRISGADAEAIRHGSELTIINLGQLAATDVITLGSASIYIDNVEQNDFSLMRVEDADGTSRIVVAPEPATATLSLLALAALAARRKRH